MKFLTSLPVNNIVKGCCWAIAGLLLAHGWGFFFLDTDTIPGKLLDINREKNFATAFSTLLLLSCAGLLWQIYRTRREGSAEKHRQRFLAHWRLLALIFGAMAMDESIAFHERLGSLLRSYVETQGVLFYSWVIPGIAFVTAFAIGYARFIAALPFATRCSFLLAGCLYVSGAIGMEMVSGYYVNNYGVDNRAVIAALNGLEETAEMLGAAAFIRALLIYLQLEEWPDQ